MQRWKDLEENIRGAQEMILSASRRTDIPAFYADWFCQRLREGFVCVRNPMNEHQVSRISLSPEVVDCIVFWTKDAAPMLEKLEYLTEYDYYFQFTLNSYGRDVEPYVPERSRRLETFQQLSEKIGRERVIWRYDPILFSPSYSPEFHLRSFEETASVLGACTEKCVFSFVDLYPSKNSGSLKGLNAYWLSPEELDGFAGELSRIGKRYGLTLAACAESVDLTRHGIQHNSCIDRELIQRMTGAVLDVGADGQRGNCRCVKCDDIGAYDTCPHGCAYCYANVRPHVVSRKRNAYDVRSPLLCGSIRETDRVTERPVKSYKRKYEQLTLFDERENEA